MMINERFFHPTFSRLGTGLCAADQSHVLAVYVHRYTREHAPTWATGQQDYKPQFASDADWLAHTRFVVRVDGRLDARVRRCYSTPTWPEGK